MFMCTSIICQTESYVRKCSIAFGVTFSTCKIHGSLFGLHRNSLQTRIENSKFAKQCARLMILSVFKTYVKIQPMIATDSTKLSYQNIIHFRVVEKVS